MYCRHCGIKNAEGMPTCTACGSPLTNGPQSQVNQAARNPYSPEDPLSNNPYQSANQLGGTGFIGEKPKNYLVESILVTLCCCLPIGIAGIVFAAQVDSKWNAGDHAGAQESAANAKKFVLIAFGIGIVVQVIGLAINLASIGANANR